MSRILPCHPFPIFKMRVGFKEHDDRERSTVCVWGQGEVNREMDVGEVSAFPGPCPQTPRPGSGQSRGDLMAQAPHSPCNLLHSHPSPPHIPSNVVRVCSYQAPGVFYLDPLTQAATLPPGAPPPPSPFPGFLQFPPAPGLSHSLELGWTGQGQAPGAA